MRTIVIGSLGELVKKLVELELRMQEKDPPLASEIAAYSSIYEEWPVEDRSKVDNLSTAMKFEIIKYRDLEKQLEEMLKTANNSSLSDFFWIKKTLSELFLHRDIIKGLMGRLNTQGRGAGKPASFDMVEESNEAQVT